MKVISVCGITSSGKTTTIAKIIEGLRTRGHRVGAVKDIHFKEYPQDGDSNSITGRYRSAGAGLTAVRADAETDLIFPGRLPTAKLLALFEGECDYLVLEGVEDLDLPTVVTAHTHEDLAARWSENAICVSGRISAKLEEYRGKPAINALDRPGALIDLIEEVCVDK